MALIEAAEYLMICHTVCGCYLGGFAVGKEFASLLVRDDNTILVEIPDGTPSATYEIDGTMEYVGDSGDFDFAHDFGKGEEAFYFIWDFFKVAFGVIKKQSLNERLQMASPPWLSELDLSGLLVEGIEPAPDESLETTDRQKKRKASEGDGAYFHPSATHDIHPSSRTSLPLAKANDTSEGSMLPGMEGVRERIAVWAAGADMEGGAAPPIEQVEEAGAIAMDGYENGFGGGSTDSDRDDDTGGSRLMVLHDIFRERRAKFVLVETKYKRAILEKIKATNESS
ncbi:hypothetical protein IAR50_005292 [Cryptococcus sp. DSM 104548]